MDATVSVTGNQSTIDKGATVGTTVEELKAKLEQVKKDHEAARIRHEELTVTLMKLKQKIVAAGGEVD